MRIGIVRHGFCDYVSEVFRTWGRPLFDVVDVEEVANIDPTETPVLIAPSGAPSENLLEFAKRGGLFVSFLPDDAVASAVRIVKRELREDLCRLRVTAFPAAGVAGEQLPLAGPAEHWEIDPTAETVAYLAPARGYSPEGPAIVRTAVGSGHILAFAFDLPHAVMLLRQGDPNMAEKVPPGDTTARPSHFACDLGDHGAGWIPFADMLSKLMVDIVISELPSPAPMLWHLPDDASGILVFSGDEDGGPVEANYTQFDALNKAQARMNLYIVPNSTLSTPKDVKRYAERHDLGPHPDITPFYDRAVPERLAEFERQIRLFEAEYGIKAKSLRNHCTAWAGYLEPVEVMEKLGVRMDTNFMSGAYLRARDPSPYGVFGSAMPMCFVRPNGRLLNVFQQHTHIGDDCVFGSSEYSYKVSPNVFDVIARRIFTDITERFHTPLAVCIHPANWMSFSEPQGRALLRLANEFGLPIWSFDQWLTFLEARNTWQFDDLTWDGSELSFIAKGKTEVSAISLVLPMEFQGRMLKDVMVSKEHVAVEKRMRYGGIVAMIPLPSGRTEALVRAKYH